jgi:hypothetical protein
MRDIPYVITKLPNNEKITNHVEFRYFLRIIDSS